MIRRGACRRHRLHEVAKDLSAAAHVIVTIVLGNRCALIQHRARGAHVAQRRHRIAARKYRRSGRGDVIDYGVSRFVVPFDRRQYLSYRFFRQSLTTSIGLCALLCFC
jgi:hypothetical protein